MNNEYFVAENLEKSFGEGDNRREILKIQKITAAEGEFVSILGPSGCGKSTLLNIIGGFEVPDNGIVKIDGSPPNCEDQNCITVFQDPGLFPWKTVYENVCFGLKLKNINDNEIKQIADYHIELVGLREFSNLFPRELSGGMRQRVAIARALAVNPKLLLMDEPFSAVDALTRLQLQNELVRICAETKKTTIFITHSVDEALILGDRIIVMDKNPGRIKEVFCVDFPVTINSNDARFLDLRAKVLVELGIVP